MTRRVIGALGRGLIALGVLILLFVVYQLWGTNFAEASSQSSLAQQFRALRPDAHSPALATSGGDAPQALPGTAVAHLRIPEIGVNKYVVEGVAESDLQKGPGHYPGTPMPGQMGNVAIAGHRTTYGAPFYRLDELKSGDPVYLTTAQGTFRYLVTGSEVVPPTDVAVVDNTPQEAKLTLTTCNPRFSATTRLIVYGRLTGTPLAAARLGNNAPTTLASQGSSRAVGQTVMWGLAAAALWAAAWAAARRFGHRIVTYAVGTPAFLVLLFFFFENVSRLLPASI